MSSIVNKVTEVASLGLIKDVTGSEAAGRAAGRAAELQAGAAGSAAAEQARQFDITQQRLQEAQKLQQSQLAPFRQAGVSALQQQQALLGLSGAPAQEEAFAAFNESPGQKFLRERGQRNLLRNASAIGGLGGGNVRSALVQQGVGFAQQDFQNQFGRLASLSGAGQSAAGGIGQGALGTAGQVGQFGAQAASNIGNLQQQGAAARASGILGQQQAEAQATGQVLGLGGTILGGLAGLGGLGGLGGAAAPANALVPGFNTGALSGFGL